jgi:hypothetical protein
MFGDMLIHRTGVALNGKILSHSLTKTGQIVDELGQVVGAKAGILKRTVLYVDYTYYSIIAQVPLSDPCLIIERETT